MNITINERPLEAVKLLRDAGISVTIEPEKPAEAPREKIKAGDVVQLRNRAGPEMVVGAVHTGGTSDCAWFDGSDHLQRMSLYTALLWRV